MPARMFVVARNPEPGSRLPYLIRVPLADGNLVLKARAPWPRTEKVYCHRADRWPDAPEVLEEIPVRSCVRRGVAIDLVLERPRERRSQLVFATVRGREAIFWQSPRTAAAARPGIRIPTRRAAGQEGLHVLVDTRERYPYRFGQQQATTERRALPAGDYAVELDGVTVAAVERKSLEDLAGSLVDGGLVFTMADLDALDRAAVVVEDRYSVLFKLEHVSAGFVADRLAAVQVRYPQVPVVFCDTRKLAEEYTFRFLGAALALAHADHDQLLSPP
jgi:hypothetical protein